MYLPELPPDAFLPLPGEVSLPGSPREIRIYKSPQMPPEISAGTPEATEIVWRIFVALALHSSWAAVNGPTLLGVILLEWLETDPDVQVEDSYLLRHYGTIDDLGVGCMRALDRFARDGFILSGGRDHDTLVVLPEMLARCQVPEEWGAENLLQL